MKLTPVGKAHYRIRRIFAVIFSSFGLGILDIAVGKLVRDLGLKLGRGTIIDSFLPEPWVEDDER